MSQYTAITRRAPLEENPRNPYREGSRNIGFILKQALETFNRNNFGRPWANNIYTHRLRMLPPDLPVVDIKMARCKPEKRNSGTQQVMVTYHTTYEIRYLYAVSDSSIDEEMVERNLWCIHDELEHNNDIHGLCPSIRADILDVDGSERFYPEFGEWVLGGIITALLPITLQRNFWDGTNAPRDIGFPTGSRH